VRGAISGREESLRDGSGVAARIHGGRGGGVEAHDHGRGSGERSNCSFTASPLGDPICVVVGVFW
jgi:hypothetical protein